MEVPLGSHLQPKCVNLCWLYFSMYVYICYTTFKAQSLVYAVCCIYLLEPRAKLEACYERMRNVVRGGGTQAMALGGLGFDITNVIT